jgi:hypothetical protein
VMRDFAETIECPNRVAIVIEDRNVHVFFELICFENSNL